MPGPVFRSSDSRVHEKRDAPQSGSISRAYVRERVMLRLSRRVVSLVVDVAGCLVLFMVYLPFFALRQLAAVGRAIRSHLLVDRTLLILKLSRFTCR
jgi:hypothetical protein